MVETQTTAPQNGAPDLKTLVEAFILVSDGPVSQQILAQALEQDEQTIEQTLNEIEQDYSTRGIRLQRMRDRAQFVSAPEVSEQVQKYLGLDTAPRLSPASLETLAIIAYRQPITRPQIENIRGVNCDGVVHTLLARNLIEAVGELDTVGHPTIYGTTFDFLHYFGMTGLEQLPPLPDNVIPVLTMPTEKPIEEDIQPDAPVIVHEVTRIEPVNDSVEPEQAESESTAQAEDVEAAQNIQSESVMPFAEAEQTQPPDDTLANNE